jgi:hypothetical protein
MYSFKAKVKASSFGFVRGPFLSQNWRVTPSLFLNCKSGLSHAFDWSQCSRLSKSSTSQRASRHLSASTLNSVTIFSLDSFIKLRCEELLTELWQFHSQIQSKCSFVFQLRDINIPTSITSTNLPRFVHAVGISIIIAVRIIEIDWLLREPRFISWLRIHVELISEREVSPHPNIGLWIMHCLYRTGCMQFNWHTKLRR